MAAEPQPAPTQPAPTQAAPSQGIAGDGYSRDELTGVLNRQSGHAAIGREVERCRREGQHLVLGYLNVDGMREVNESSGPRAGDDLLRKVAAGLRATLRSYDVIMRLAGDEFLFSLPGADLTTAEKRIKEFAIILGEEAPGASVSVGFAELLPEDSVDDLVARADDALVQARRRRGRRRLR
jgi:diguanylate cyclase (GGDEF)-like protein